MPRDRNDRVSDVPDSAPLTEADAVDDEDVWVSVEPAARSIGRSIAWIEARCRSGALPCREAPGDERVVPIVAARDLSEEAKVGDVGPHGV